MKIRLPRLNTRGSESKSVEKGALSGSSNVVTPK